MTTWIIVANGSRARVFSAKSSTGSIEEIETLIHPEGRVHEQTLTSDLPGRTFDRAGPGRHAMEAKVGTKQQKQIGFATRVADYVEAARENHKYRSLFVVAAPNFLGLIRSKLTRDTTACVDFWMDKDLTSLSKEEIRKRLPERLW